jgi:hypothetical protein
VKGMESGGLKGGGARGREVAKCKGKGGWVSGGVGEGRARKRESQKGRESSKEAVKFQYRQTDRQAYTRKPTLQGKPEDT